MTCPAVDGIVSPSARVRDPEDPLALGDFRTIPGRTGVVLGIPHGTFDASTDEIGGRVATLTGAAAVIATGFCASRTQGVRLNVNRPTEGASLVPSAETVTARARAVHLAYVARVRAVARGPLTVYCEIHGNSRPTTAGRIEVATAGVNAVLADRLKRAVHDRVQAVAQACATRLGLWIEPVDRLHFAASSARRWPPFTEAHRVLHVELPRAARAPGGVGEATADLIAALLGALEIS